MSGLQLFAISIFWIIAALGLVMVVMLLFKPGAVYPNFKLITGLDFEALIKAKTVQEPAVNKLLNWTASILLGSNGMTFFLAVSAFRDQHWLAWCALWYWPLMFLWHFAIYPRKTFFWYLQLVWILLSVFALLKNLPAS